MKRVIHEDLLMSAFFILIGLLFFLNSSELPSETTRFPLLCAAGMIIMSIPIFVRGVKKTIASAQMTQEERDKVPLRWSNVKIPLLTFLMVVAYACCSSHIGFFVSTFVFMMALLFLQQYRKPVNMVLVTVGFEVLVYLIFVLELHLRLPKGILF